MAKTTNPQTETSAGSDAVSPPASSDEPALASDTAQAEPAVDEEWTPVVTKWYDMDNYGCPKCPFDSIELDRTVQHIYLAHILPAAQGFHEKE